MSVVTVAANFSSRGTVTGGGTYSVGSQVTVTANSNSGYFFACWSDSSKGVVVSDQPSYTFTVEKDTTLIAYFYSEIDSVAIYGMCGANCKHRVMSVGQAINLIQEMAKGNFSIPANYVPKTAVNTIIEQNKGVEMSIFVGTQAEWNAWKGDKEHTFKFITDTNIGLEDAIAKILNGERIVGMAEYANEVNPAQIPLVVDATYNYDNLLKWYKENKGVDFNFIPYKDEQGQWVYPLVPAEHGIAIWHCSRTPIKGDIFTFISVISKNGGREVFRLTCEVNERGTAVGGGTTYSYYIKDYTLLSGRADNADKVNNLEITKDANGVLKIGNIIIPQKRLVRDCTNEPLSISENFVNIYAFTSSIKGKIFEIQIDNVFYKFSCSGSNIYISHDGYAGDLVNAATFEIANTYSNALYQLRMRRISSMGGENFVYKLYEIIE